MKLRNILYLATIAMIFTSVANACGCVSIEQPIEKVRVYYKNNFNGAIFTGKIKSIRDVPVATGDQSSLPLRKLTIEVDEYWLGVDKPVIKVLTIGGLSLCAVKWETDRTQFFIAYRDKQGLHVGMCDLSSWRGRYPDKEWSDYTLEVLGPAKSFRDHQGAGIAIGLIMIPRLDEVYSIIGHPINQSMFLRYSARPNSGAFMTKRLWFPDAFEWIAHDRFDQFEYL